MNNKLPARYNTLGFDTDNPWSLPALKMIYNAPRVYKPWVDTLTYKAKNLEQTFDKLTDLGVITFEKPHVYDLVSGVEVDKPSRKVPRYRLTSLGEKTRDLVKDDPRAILKTYPRVDEKNMAQIADLLNWLSATKQDNRLGMSMQGLATLTSLPMSNVKWWVNRWVQDGLAIVLPDKHADARELIPAHWRLNRKGTTLLKDLTAAFPQHGRLRYDFRLGSVRPLRKINATRVSIGGATDYTHDINCQKILGQLMVSPTVSMLTPFRVEPKFSLPISQKTKPWAFAKEADNDDSYIAYQPDAFFYQTTPDINLNVLEYERKQSRRDGFSHIQRLLGYVYTQVKPETAVTVRFVVDSRRREKTYTELIEAFADHLIDKPEWGVKNEVTLAVSSAERLNRVSDRLRPDYWHQIDLPPTENENAAPVMHNKDNSPFDQYFKN